MLSTHEFYVSEEIAKTTSSPQENHLTIVTKYGPVEVNLARAISFPQGLLGMPSNTDYCITNFPKANMQQFSLLQNLNDHELCFAVLPLDPSADIFDTKDIEEACNVTQIKREHMVVLSIVSVQRSEQDVKVTANVRAPLLIDSERRVGIQYVFPSNRYDIRHVISHTKRQ